MIKKAKRPIKMHKTAILSIISHCVIIDNIVCDRYKYGGSCVIKFDVAHVDIETGRVFYESGSN